MNSTLLIPKHDGFHARRTNLVKFVEHKSTGVAGTPAHYSILSRTDGRVVLTEYRDAQEYSAHKTRVMGIIAKRHLGNKHTGCSCTSCLYL